MEIRVRKVGGAGGRWKGVKNASCGVSMSGEKNGGKTSAAAADSAPKCQQFAGLSVEMASEGQVPFG